MRIGGAKLPFTFKLEWGDGSVKRTIAILLLTTVGLLVIGETALAQERSLNPLLEEIERSDPVIPAGYGKRQLSSFEKYRIENEIAELDRLAKAELQQGNQDRAFELWYRQLKLIRVVDPEAEISALGELGNLAWQENRGQELRQIAERLIVLEENQVSAESLSLEEITKLATAYRQVRYLDRAIALQARAIELQRQNENYSPALEEENLAALGQLYLAKFDYQNAAKIYRELLARTDTAESRGNKRTREYLATLIDIYDRTAQTAKAIAVKQRLISLYTDTQADKVSLLAIAIARDYQTLNQPERAVTAYNRAFDLASQTQRFATASDALTELAELHQKQSQPQKAIATYLKLLKIHQQTYNYYGAIDTYDSLGKIHLELQQKAQARKYFERGLELAKSLNHDVEYLNRQIRQLK